MRQAVYDRPGDPRGWINSLPPTVEAQADVLLRLFDAAEADARVRALRVRGSLARGTADEYSDIDTRLWLSDDAYDAALADLVTSVKAIAETIDVLFDSPESPYRLVQYANGVQLELSTARASDTSGRDSGVVVLLDRDGFWAEPYAIDPVWDEKLWLGWGWMALADVDKYLRRGSVWEALMTLAKARSLSLRHHAAETGMRDPEYGLTSILDYGGKLPEGLEGTVAALDSDAIRRAAHACAELLSAHDQRPFAKYVMARLAGASSDGERPRPHTTNREH